MVLNEKYRLDITQSAKNDLEEIFNYIATDLKMPQAASKKFDKILTKIGTLKNFPSSYELVKFKQFRVQNYRKLVVDNYLVFYVVHEDLQLVKIYRVIYNKRNYEKLL